MWSELFMIMLFTVMFLYWQSAQKVKEIALAATIRHCYDMELQMLDGYIALQSMSLKKDRRGQLHIVRAYLFEFSSTGAERYNGKILMFGRRIESMQLDPYRV